MREHQKTIPQDLLVEVCLLVFLKAVAPVPGHSTYAHRLSADQSLHSNADPTTPAGISPIQRKYGRPNQNTKTSGPTWRRSPLSAHLYYFWRTLYGRQPSISRFVCCINYRTIVTKPPSHPQNCGYTTVIPRNIIFDCPPNLTVIQLGHVAILKHGPTIFNSFA